MRETGFQIQEMSKVNYYKRFSSKALAYVEEVEKAGKGNKLKLDDISRRVYSDYKSGKISVDEYDRIHALLMEYRYPR